jgi:hypothetical protein
VSGERFEPRKAKKSFLVTDYADGHRLKKGVHRGGVVLQKAAKKTKGEKEVQFSGSVNSSGLCVFCDKIPE